MLSIKLVEEGDNLVYKTMWELSDDYVTQFQEDTWHQGQLFYQVSNKEMNYHVTPLRFQLMIKISIFSLQFRIVAQRGNSLKEGFVGLDELEFIGTSKCEFKPLEADPDYQPPTTPTTPSTPEPTEPPNCKISKLK